MGMNNDLKTALRKKPPAIGLNDSVETAIEMLVSGCSSALVVMRDGELIGLVTEGDLLHSINRGGDPQGARVSEVMSPCELITAKGTKSPCVQLDEGQTVGDALQIMEEAGTRHLLVTGAGGDVVGIATITDLLGIAVA